MHSLCAGDNLLASHEDVVAAAVLGVCGIGHGVEGPHLPHQHLSQQAVRCQLPTTGPFSVA